MVQWCDNKQAVHDSMNFPYRPANMMGADTDLVLAIHYLKLKLTTTINCRHVYGHQDRGRKKTDVKGQECPSLDEAEPQEITDRGAAPPQTTVEGHNNRRHLVSHELMRFAPTGNTTTL